MPQYAVTNQKPDDERCGEYVVVEFPLDIVRGLRNAAAARDRSVVSWIRDIVEVVGREDLVAAVLDDVPRSRFCLRR